MAISHRIVPYEKTSDFRVRSLPETCSGDIQGGEPEMVDVLRLWFVILRAHPKSQIFRRELLRSKLRLPRSLWITLWLCKYDSPFARSATSAS